MKYSEEETKYAVEEYKKAPTRETVEAVAKKLERSARSVIGKLSKEGVYQRENYMSKTGEKPETKIEICNGIEFILELEENSLHELHKAPKLTLKKLRTSIQKLAEVRISGKIDCN